jgi:hypothetical protein
MTPQTNGRRVLLTLVVAAATFAIAVTSGLAATQLPGVPTYLSSPASGLKIRPTSITYTGDGTGVLGGISIKGAIHWTSWTSQRALGTGYDRIDTCEKSCAGGPFFFYPVRLEAWRPGTLHGRLVFTRLTRWYTDKVPAGSSSHYTFTDLYQYGGWGFSPPAANGYCYDTGQPAEAGCKNIHSLPPSS